MLRFLKTWFGSKKSAPSSRPQRPACRLTLEALEDRQMMSATAVNVTSTQVDRPLVVYFNGTYVRDASTGAIDRMQNGQRCWLSPAAYASLGSPAFANISDGAFRAIPAGPDYIIPNGTFLRDASTGAIDVVENTQGCWLSPPVYAYLGSPPPMNISDYAFSTLPKGPNFFPNGMIVTAENHPTAGSAYSAVPETKANFNSPNTVLYGSAQQPSYLDVHQGTEGDCWLLASLAAVAARSPSGIKSMFTFDGTGMENGAVVGFYSVRFFNSAGVAKYVTVDTELPSGGNLYDHPANGGLWVSLVEKAYVQANAMKYVTTAHVGTDSYDALGNLNNSGGNPTWALQAITGKSANSFSINPSNIAAAWNKGEYIVLASSTTPTSSYIVGNRSETHAYAVVGYNASSSQPFKVFNPWGTNSSGWALGTFNGHQVYGLFTADAAFLSHNFASQFVGSGAQNTNNVADASDGVFLSRLDSSLPTGPAHSHLLGHDSQEIADFWGTQSSQSASRVPARTDEAFLDTETLAMLRG